MLHSSSSDRVGWLDLSSVLGATRLLERLSIVPLKFQFINFIDDFDRTLLMSPEPARDGLSKSGVAQLSRLVFAGDDLAFAGNDSERAFSSMSGAALFESEDSSLETLS